MRNKRIVALTIVLLLIGLLFHAPHLLADENPIMLSNITLVEHVFIGSYDTSYDKIEFAKASGDDKFLLLSLPHRFSDTILSTNDTQSRGDIYCQPIQAIPVIAIDGVVDQRDKETSDHWPEIIKKGIQNHKDQATFSYKKLPTGQYEVTTIGGSDDLIKMDNLYMNVIFFQDWVPCTWENGDTTVRNLAKKFPLGPYGQKVKLANNKVAIARFDVILPSDYMNMYGFVALLQDFDTNKIVASGYLRFSDTEKPAYFQWNNWPKFTYDPVKNTILEEYMMTTGVSEMKFYVKNAKDLKLLTLELDYKEAELDVYEILGCILPEGMNPIFKFTFDPLTKKVSLVFKEPINGDKELFSFLVHWKKENFETSSNFKIKSLTADNSKNNTLYFDLGDIRQYYPNMLFVQKSPLDFNEDTWINDNDLTLLLDQFGRKESDIGFDKKFDLYLSDGEPRIDMNDVLILLSYINKQDALLEKIPK